MPKALWKHAFINIKDIHGRLFVIHVQHSDDRPCALNGGLPLERWIGAHGECNDSVGACLLLLSGLSLEVGLRWQVNHFLSVVRF